MSGPVPAVVVIVPGFEVAGGVLENVAITFWSYGSATVHVPVPEQAPLQPVNVEPDAGVAVNVTDDWGASLAEHSPGQLIPPPITVPWPAPSTSTERRVPFAISSARAACVSSRRSSVGAISGLSSANSVLAVPAGSDCAAARATWPTSAPASGLAAGMMCGAIAAASAATRSWTSNETQFFGSLVLGPFDATCAAEACR